MSEAAAPCWKQSKREKKRNANRQRQLQRCTGFAGEAYEKAHEVVDELRKLSRFTESTRWFAGQLVAHGGVWSFEGNYKIAELGGFSVRTAQRDRKALEDAGLITSYRLQPGDRVPGMKHPVRRHQVVRNCAGLLALVKKDRRPRRAVRARATTVPTPPLARNVAARADAASPDLFGELAKKAPWLSEHFVTIAAAFGSTPPPAHPRPEKRPAPAHVEQSEVDAWDDDTERLERGEPRPRPPPQ